MDLEKGIKIHNDNIILRKNNKKKIICKKTGKHGVDINKVLKNL